VRCIGPDILVNPCLLLGKNLGITHVGESSSVLVKMGPSS